MKKITEKNILALRDGLEEGSEWGGQNRVLWLILSQTPVQGGVENRLYRVRKTRARLKEALHGNFSKDAVPEAARIQRDLVSLYEESKLDSLYGEAEESLCRMASRLRAEYEALDRSFFYGFADSPRPINEICMTLAQQWAELNKKEEALEEVLPPECWEYEEEGVALIEERTLLVGRISTLEFFVNYKVE